MQTVNVTEFRQHLPNYLNMVQMGDGRSGGWSFLCDLGICWKVSACFFNCNKLVTIIT